jgi:2-polyprenyl-3-methyl-5-hydroxy-6-metoxy-1,4-benzoquinol methylase
MFSSLANRVAQSPNLKNVYVPIHAALENEALLSTKGLYAGTIDTVVCMQVLCSVSDPARAIERIHALLKPGGELLFWEHEAGLDSWTRLVQRTTISPCVFEGRDSNYSQC